MGNFEQGQKVLFEPYHVDTPWKEGIFKTYSLNGKTCYISYITKTGSKQTVIRALDKVEPLSSILAKNNPNITFKGIMK